MAAPAPPAPLSRTAAVVERSPAPARHPMREARDPDPQEDHTAPVLTHDPAVDHERSRYDTEPAYADPEPDWPPEVVDAPEPERPRRNRARLWTVLAVIAAAVMLAAVALIYTIGLPELTARLGFAATSAPALAISGTARPEQLPTGKLLLTVNGQLRNLTDEVQRVPQIRADVLDPNGRSIYSWSIAPPVAQLGPRESATFNSASTDVPTGGRNLSLSFAPLT